MVDATKLVALYGLYDPRTGALRYIGKAAKPNDRYRRHCKPGLDAMRLPVSRWCRDLVALGLQPRMRVFTWARDWETVERRLIAAHRKAGADLLNVARGGVDIPAGRSRSVGLSSPLWRKTVGHFIFVIKLVDEPFKTEWRELLHQTGRFRRAILLRFGRPVLLFYDRAFHAQMVLDEPLAFVPLPGFD